MRRLFLRPHGTFKLGMAPDLKILAPQDKCPSRWASWAVLYGHAQKAGIYEDNESTRFDEWAALAIHFQVGEVTGQITNKAKS
jgi:hypothetical protein